VRTSVLLATIALTVGLGQAAHAAPRASDRGRNAVRLRDVLTFNWEMVATGTEEVAAVGREFVVLAGDGRIRLDYQFIER
jgi:hypothetical protein